MNFKRTLLISLAITAVMAGGAAWALGRIGADTPVPTHFGLHGPDRFAPARLALWAHPAMALAMTVLFAALPAVMPKNARLERSAVAYRAVWLAVVLVLAATQATMVAAPLGLAVEPSRVIPLVVGALLLVMGNLLGKIRYNYVFGVRTPWTLASERVWDRTHRFMGPWFVGWGAVLLTALFAPATLFGMNTAMLALAGGAALVTVLACAYSYLASRKLEATPAS